MGQAYLFTEILEYRAEPEITAGCVETMRYTFRTTQAGTDSVRRLRGDYGYIMEACGSQETFGAYPRVSYADIDLAIPAARSMSALENRGCPPGIP